MSLSVCFTGEVPTDVDSDQDEGDDEVQIVVPVGEPPRPAVKKQFIFQPYKLELLVRKIDDMKISIFFENKLLEHQQRDIPSHEKVKLWLCQRYYEALLKNPATK